MEIRTTDTARIWVDDEGITHIVATGAASTADTAAATAAVIRELTEESRTPILFDVRRWPSGDPAFWREFIYTIESVCLAGAFVVDAEERGKLGTYPDKIDSLLLPFRVFTDEQEALAFLRESLGVNQSR